MQQNWSNPADGTDQIGFKAVITSLISSYKIYEKRYSNRDSSSCTRTIYPSISCDADTRTAVEIADVSSDIIANLFHAGTDFTQIDRIFARICSFSESDEKRESWSIPSDLTVVP